MIVKIKVMKNAPNQSIWAVLARREKESGEQKEHFLNWHSEIEGKAGSERISFLWHWHISLLNMYLLKIGAMRMSCRLRERVVCAVYSPISFRQVAHKNLDKWLQWRTNRQKHKAVIMFWWRQIIFSPIRLRRVDGPLAFDCLVSFRRLIFARNVHRNSTNSKLLYWSVAAW